MLRAHTNIAPIVNTYVRLQLIDNMQMPFNSSNLNIGMDKIDIKTELKVAKHSIHCEHLFQHSTGNLNCTVLKFHGILSHSFSETASCFGY